jgi:hypothetical protein
MWPHYDHAPLGDRLSFSATFESYNQRLDDAYYIVTLHDGGNDLPPFRVVLSVAWVGGGDWEKPDFAPKLGEEIAKYAKDGKTNVSESPIFRF